ncbi:MlaA family lipoprotein [Novosphingobium sp.]|uniref:MlaA family lipoprotein n=1 Tax=Novosphingobium sp. TaxID=1874826 RepID=UPI003BAC21C2
MASTPPADVLPPAPTTPAAAPAVQPPVAQPPVAKPSVAQPPANDELPPLPGEIVVSGVLKAPPGDPLAKVNETSYDVLQAVDDAFVGPVANVYEKGVPRPLRMALRNFIRNVREPVVAAAFMLELKPGKAFETVGRFGINSTIGLGGTIDVARSKPFNLPYRQNGLANVLGYYGVGPGPYLFLPLVGPTTVRDLFGLIADRLVVPLAVGKPFNKPYYAIPIGVIDSIDYRNEADEDFKRLRKAADPYATYRRVYLQSRIDQIEALHGRGPLAKGQVRYGPFARPVGAAAAPVSAAEKRVMEQDDKAADAAAGQEAAPAAPTVPDVAAPPAPPPAPPAPPLPPVFISQPVVQPLP